MATKFFHSKNGAGQLFWMADNASGLFIHRKKDHIGSFYYTVSQWHSNGMHEIASFDTLAAAKFHVQQESK